MVGEGELVDELDELGIPVPGETTLDKLRELCISHRIDASGIVAEWLAYQCSNSNVQLNPDTLESFERERLAKRRQKNNKTPTSAKSNITQIYDSTTLEDVMEDESDELLDAYSTPVAKKLAHKKRQLTPDGPCNKRLTSMGRSPVTPFSPGSFSPASSGKTPSQKYSSRANSGEVVSTFGNCDKVSWRKSLEPSEVTIVPYDTSIMLAGKFKYMFQKLSDKAHVLNDWIDDMAAHLQKQHNIEDLAHVALPVQDNVTVVGRVCCDSVGKLNSKSVVLEGSRDTSSGKRIPVDLSQVSQYSLFPGQVVAMEGVNTTGNNFVVKKIYEDVSLPLPAERPSPNSLPVKIVIASGPFTTSDSLTYEPLSDLINSLQKNTPDVCILLGPFVDVKFPDLEEVIGAENNTFEECFNGVISKLRTALKRLQVQLILVPSWRDVHHEYVYPQPPYHLDLSPEDQRWIHLVSDPSTLNINGSIIGITSTDILFHLGAEEISSPAGGSDRLARLAKHVLTQQSYYPLCPPSEDVNIDYDHFEVHAKLPLTPHILILPSDLRYFIKDVNGCCCVNPGRLAKGQVGGTYARIAVLPSGQNSSKSLCQSIAGQILRV